VIRLLAVEVRRNLGRRVTQLLVLAFVAMTVAGVGLVLVNAETHTDTEIAAAHQRGLDYCVSDVIQVGAPPPEAFGTGDDGAVTVAPQPVAPDDADRVCRELLQAYLDGTNPEIWYFDDPRPKITHDLWRLAGDRTNGILLTVIALLMIGGLGAGASMIGAEWKFGTVTTQLTWEPRRTRIVAAKLIATAGCAFVIAVALQAVFSAGAAVVFAAKGSTQGMDADWYLSLAAAFARGGLLTAVAATLGASLALMMRNTAAPILLVFAYTAIVENIVRGVRPGWSRWLIGENIGVVVTAQTRAIDWDTTAIAAAATLVGYAAVLAVAAGASFHRRDIAGSS
jgi:ABC-type transport system involved in multi-copper enzyme maturation permease subunit